MNTLFFIILTLFLIVMQTIILPSFVWFAQCFDLLIINVLFLSLISSHYSMVAAIIIIGCIMDSISGVPFCYHIFSYLWIYIIVHLVKHFFFKRSILFILIISILSVVIQHGLLLFSVFINQGFNAVFEFDFTLLIRQVVWGLVFIPPGIWMVKVLWQNWIFITKSMRKQMSKKYRGYN
ncbi:rod shape-determining protein MreD [Desulfobacula phenolica]|uniref:Rod shape-determining protein MreD n=1 Tax=Desulfobacula phenolica TaxID=90732 RepID=A0A1H2G5Q7_9BACT|nr:rod shape-determining protein MreD [Desulfobacula phenolica]